MCNIRQKREKIRPKVCTNCELIFCQGRDIIEILRASLVGAQPKGKPQGFPWGLFRTPYQLPLFPRCPAVNALLVHYPANRQGVLLGGDTLTNVHIVDPVAEPDANITGTTQAPMENNADLFRGLTFYAGDADLPTGFILYNFAVAKGQAFIIGQVADGANIDTAISDVLHNSLSFLLEISSPFVILVYHSLMDLSSIL